MQVHICFPAIILVELCMGTSFCATDPVGQSAMTPHGHLWHPTRRPVLDTPAFSTL